MLIEAHHIRKAYGHQTVLDDINFSVDRGEIVGLLGPNGSGKTTLMRILTTFLRPDAGEALIDGFSVLKAPMEVRRRIGYLPEHNPLYTDMYVREYLNFVRRFYENISRARVEEVIEQTGLTPESHKKIGQLSKGYRQRVGLAAAIIHRPSVLILDEPTTGLDPNQLVEIRELIKDLGRDTGILLSTHIMQEVEQMAGRVLILYQGKIRLDTPLDKLHTGRQMIRIELDTAVEDRWWKQFPGITGWENLGGNLWELHFDTTDDMRPAIFDWTVSQGLKILRMETKKTNLEEIFRELTH